MDRGTFAHLVREALNHLYDQAYLERHPLNAVLAADAAGDAGVPTLHRLLLEGIEALRPPPHVSRTAARWRPYLILFSRYVDGMEPAQVAQELAISPRQYRREQAKGLELLTDLLWKKRQALPVAPVRSLLDAEVDRLGTAPVGRGTSLAGTVEGVVATLTPLAARRQLSLTTRLAAHLPALAVDRVVLRQILLSVLGQAIESGAGGAVELAAHPKGQQMELVVTLQAEPANPPGGTEEQDRLAVAARLVDSLGGRMSVEREGSLCIRLVLPAQRRPTVLVIDDNPDVVQLFRRYLSGGAYHVVGAADGREALRLAQETRPQAITLDVMMPDQDGWELLQTLKNLPATKDIPVIVCSVLRERTLALSLGASEFVAKPVTQEVLLSALVQCLAGPTDAAHPGRPSDSA